MHDLLEAAFHEFGVTEVPGDGNNKRILDYAEDAGFQNYSEDSTPWCSIFMNWVAVKAGYEHSGSGTARSWLQVGQDVGKPEPGDVVVFWRVARDSWQGHVGFFMGFSQDQKRIYCFGGNQNDRVDLTAYPAERLLGFRRLRPVDDKLPDPPLKHGDNGAAIRALQMALNLGGFDSGTADSIFGPKTERAVKMLQSTDDAIAITGVYDEETRELLASVLDEC